MIVLTGAKKIKAVILVLFFQTMPLIYRGDFLRSGEGYFCFIYLTHSCGPKFNYILSVGGRGSDASH